MLGWLESGVPAHQIMVLVPQRTMGMVYQQALRRAAIPNAASVDVVTLGGLARRNLSQFWSKVAPSVNPDWAGRDPIFLTIETAQYYMAQLIEPIIEQGLFDGINLEKSRIVAQTLDNLSKAAVNDFTLDEIATRLSAAWIGHSSRERIYESAVEAGKIFQAYCREHLLLDFSLQVEYFMDVLLPDATVAAHLRNQYRYIIVDNLEENFPVTFDFVAWLWETLEDAVLVYDTDGGYRLFLGASPELAHGFHTYVDEVREWTQPVNQAAPMTQLTEALLAAFAEAPAPDLPDVDTSFTLEFSSFYPQMIDNAIDRVIQLVNEGVPPGEIVILAPFLGDSLRFTIFNRLEAANIPFVSHRPSRALRDEPVTQAVLVLMSLAYPDAPTLPKKADVARAFAQLIDDLDPIRAELLAQIVYRANQDELGSFDSINQTMQQRITYRIGERYENLRLWLAAFREVAPETPPDHFMKSLFDFMAQPGYRFHVNLDAGRVVSELIDSARKFREVVAPEDRTAEAGLENWADVAHRYAALVGEGVLAAVHITEWQDENAVFVAPAYTFLTRNRFVDYQIWLDMGSNAWSERLEQPLTQPYVLRSTYPEGQLWTDELETVAQREQLRKVILGLVRRCRQHLYLGFADLGEQGFEQRGPLLRVFNTILQNYGDENETQD
jgi:hypothetical protein